jgi:hypothetical protein
LLPLKLFGHSFCSSWIENILLQASHHFASTGSTVVLCATRSQFVLLLGPLSNDYHWEKLVLKSRWLLRTLRSFLRTVFTL